MAEQLTPRAADVWLGSGDPGGEAANAFAGGALWVGEHAADGDILVFDPSEASPYAERLSFFSLKQLRTRVFPRAVVTQQIRELADELRSARARQDYGRRAELRQAHESALATARTEVLERQREQVIQRHARYMAARGIEYRGVQTTPADRRPSRRARCHACSTPLDDFSGNLCCACGDVLCSCGACACASRPAKS